MRQLFNATIAMKFTTNMLVPLSINYKNILNISLMPREGQNFNSVNYVNIYLMDHH